MITRKLSRDHEKTRQKNYNNAWPLRTSVLLSFLVNLMCSCKIEVLIYYTVPKLLNSNVCLVYFTISIHVFGLWLSNQAGVLLIILTELIKPLISVIPDTVKTYYLAQYHPWEMMETFSPWEESSWCWMEPCFQCRSSSAD